ncbi:hypothetical protein HPB51_016211 [Rhipicephalus microplus]|uniref:Tick transposon n=1 Tax=Rhipicephalus microplus TaxID=6941 RepID=A0A9J6EAI9_RHIMP|nr:hypothetical protein HPB51_016211 [Rhipicephalus microplus]
MATSRQSRHWLAAVPQIFLVKRKGYSPQWEVVLSCASGESVPQGSWCSVVTFTCRRAGYTTFWRPRAFCHLLLFWPPPGTPDVPWARWLRLFKTFLLAFGANELPAPRRRALLLHCLGTEGQRIFDALPPSTTQTKAETTSAALGVTATPDAAAGIIGTTAPTGTQDMTTEALRPPDEYDVAVEMLSKHFAAPCNVRLQRHRFRERRQLQGEPITDFAVALRELAALCNFATQADENLCEQFVAGVTCPRL